MRQDGPPEPPPFEPPSAPPRRRESAPPGPPEPPPFEPRRAPPRRPEGPWERSVQALKKLGGSAAVLATARATLDKGTLTLALPGGRPLAEGRRALRNPTVVEAVLEHYGERVKVEVEALPDTGTASDQRKALARKVLADPDVKRVMDTLGATLLRAVPLTDGE